ncbi:MAG: hypothetical protein JNK48_11690 [Bryobacterales bacterium]|nr:hypothetical protein [Bryobacterales bacterium]
MPSSCVRGRRRAAQIHYSRSIENEHSVSSHLRLDIAEYDRIIRTYIPYYDESRAVQLELLAAAGLAEEAVVVDLGGGMGSLAEAVLERFPGVRVIVRDIDPGSAAASRRGVVRFCSAPHLRFGSEGGGLPGKREGAAGRGIGSEYRCGEWAILGRAARGVGGVHGGAGIHDAAGAAESGGLVGGGYVLLGP